MRNFENFKAKMKDLGVEIVMVDGSCMYRQDKVRFIFTDGCVFQIEAQSYEYGDETALEFDLIS